MFLQIENFITAAELESIGEIARRAKFIDGKASNPHSVVKESLIVDPSDLAGQKASQIALDALQRSQEARNFIFPHRVAAPSLCRYEVGMKYGPHTDAAFLPIGPEPLRSDVSCTLFISRPDEYEGGELAVHIGTETVALKGPAGSIVFYPSTSIHQVAPVTAGVRLVMITFIESLIPDQMHRDLLHALNEVRALEGLKMDWRNRTQLGYVISNLHRMWSR